MACYLYRHIRPDKNEVFYVGVGSNTTRRAWERRKRNQMWNNVVNKVGSFEVDMILNYLTEEQAEEKEK